MLPSGYQLKGLKTDMDSESTLGYGEDIAVEDDMTVYITGEKTGDKWHSITYYYEDEIADFLELTSYNEANVEKLPKVKKKNCMFTGWYESSDRSGTPIYDTSGCTTDLILYAGFVKLATGAKSTLDVAGAGTEADPKAGKLSAG